MTTHADQDFVVHHLTDIHIGPNHCDPENKFPFVEGGKGDTNVARYESYLSHLADTNPDALPDVVVISGDLTSAGRDEEFSRAKQGIETIAAHLKKRTPPWLANDKACRVLIVPGNHDLNWEEADHCGKIERFARLSDALLFGGHARSATYREVEHTGEAYYDFGDDANVFVYLFDSTKLGGEKNPELLKLHAEYTILAEGAAAGKVTLDELRRKGEELIRADPGYIDPTELEAMKAVVKDLSPERFRIAVMHHNLSGIPTGHIEEFDTIVNAGLVKDHLMKAGFDVVLHGHRHKAHCTREHNLLSTKSERHPLFILGGGTLGCDEEAPYLELRVHGAQRAHRGKRPFCHFSVRSWKYHNDADGYTPANGSPWLIESTDRRVQRALRHIVGPPPEQSTISHRSELIDVVPEIRHELECLWSTLVDWGAKSEGWITDFHMYLSHYRRVYAVDYYRRASVQSPRFEKYLREQYEARLTRIKSSGTKLLTFSPAVYAAIKRTGWEHNQAMWRGYKLAEATSPSECELEIARVLIRPLDRLDDVDDLRNLDYDHRLFGIPLFVLDSKALAKEEIVDFVLAIGEDGNPARCYAFDTETMRPDESGPHKGARYARMFEDMLKHNNLKTVDQVTGYRQLLRTTANVGEFAHNYDDSRKTSSIILNVLREKLQPSKNKVGADIGCGTGNYTLPFVGEFGRLIGLDITSEMLEVARDKQHAGKVEWIQADATTTPLDDQSCDAVWLISALHYFRGPHQKRLFEEMFRILKKGGVLVADTEFAEQLKSLWAVKFFPSLHERYKDACLESSVYTRWLKHEIGFSDVAFENLSCVDDDDKAIRSGQDNPERFFDPTFRGGIPAFVDMEPAELESGLAALKAEMDDGTLRQTIKEHTRRALELGDRGKHDAGFIIARR